MAIFILHFDHTNS